MAESYPLDWPPGWPRTSPHHRASGDHFKQGVTRYLSNDGTSSWASRSPVGPEVARKKLFAELERMKVSGVVLSSNVPLRLDGMPRADAARARIDDPGVALYFVMKGKPMAMACDRYSTIAGNMRSLGLAIEALRQLERHGGGTMMDRAFTGFAALPSPDGSRPKRPWWKVLNYGDDTEARADLTVDEVEARFRALAKRRHPDIEGGSAEAMAELNEAREDAVRDLGGV